MFFDFVSMFCRYDDAITILESSPAMVDSLIFSGSNDPDSLVFSGLNPFGSLIFSGSSPSDSLIFSGLRHQMPSFCCFAAEKPI